MKTESCIQRTSTESVENRTSDAWIKNLSLLIFCSNPQSCFSDAYKRGGKGLAYSFAPSFLYVIHSWAPTIDSAERKESRRRRKRRRKRRRRRRKRRRRRRRRRLSIHSVQSHCQCWPLEIVLGRTENLSSIRAVLTHWCEIISEH